MAEIDIRVPHSARIWNYWLGGKDHYPVDRRVGDKVAQIFPQIATEARISRYFLLRAVRYLTAEIGVRQFLDVGTGLPTVDNTHQVAQRVAPECRIVYVDNDALVLVHARALLTSTAEGRCGYIDADLREPDKILRHAADTLDFERPIALILNGVMGHIASDDEAYSIVAQLVNGLPPGSYLALSDGVDTSRAAVAAMEWYRRSGAVPYILRSPQQIAQFFDGLRLVPPGVVPRDQWRPDPGPSMPAGGSHGCGGVASKPLRHC